MSHYFRCDARRNKPCLQKSGCSALGSVCVVAEQKSTWLAPHRGFTCTAELHSDHHCVFLRVCSQSLMNNLSRNNAGASGLARWNGEEESSLETGNQPNSLVIIWQRRRVSLGVVALQEDQVVRLTNVSIYQKNIRNNNVQQFRWRKELLTPIKWPVASITASIGALEPSNTYIMLS